jgi:uncharacterized protein YecE (DUF72 family)
LGSIRIGTSGYTYSWNKGEPSPFIWYINQGFNSIEINASFYRFPTENWIRTWRCALSLKNFTFSIKVHRSITHYNKLKKDRSFELWIQFRKSLEAIEGKIDFWLFQMPSSFKYTQENLGTLRAFFKRAMLKNKAVVEFRDPAWWKAITEVQDTGIAFCSVDAPNLPRLLITANDVVYLRVHGYKKWYDYIYSEKELDEMLLEIKNLKAHKKAIYLNNNHGMLENGIYLLSHI